MLLTKRRDFLLPQLQQGLDDASLDQEVILLRNGRTVTMDKPASFAEVVLTTEINRLQAAIARLKTGDIGAAMEVQQVSAMLKERLTQLPSSALASAAENTVQLANAALDHVQPSQLLAFPAQGSDDRERGFFMQLVMGGVAATSLSSARAA